MSREILALTAQPVVMFLLLALLGAGVFLGMAVEQLFSKLRQKTWRRKHYSQWNRHRREGDADGVAHGVMGLSPKRMDAADQLRIVMEAEFTVQPLLNKSEARVFKELDRIVISCNPTWQVMAQVSLGEILRSKDSIAYSCINSKRVDLLLMDGDCRPRHAIEYQGGAHHQGAAAARDAIKKEALRRAGIGYHEVVAGQTTPVELRRMVEKMIDWAGEPN